MYRVLRSFRDEAAGRNWSRGIVASEDDFGGSKRVKQLVEDGAIAEYEPNESAGPSPDNFSEAQLRARIAELEAENAELREKVDESDAPPPHPFEVIRGIGNEIAVALENAGFNSLEEIEGADDERLLAIPGIGKKSLEKIREHFESKE